MEGKKNTHEWRWIGQEDRLAFGDPDKLYAVDIYRCNKCGKQVSSRGYAEPASRGCRGHTK